MRYRLKGEERAKVGAKLALVLLLDRNPKGALSALRNSFQPNLPYEIEDDRRRIRAKATMDLGRHEEAIEILNRLEEESRHHYVRAEILAMAYAAVGDLDRAFDCLERAFQVRSAGLIYLHVDPGYQPLRPDPRFAQLVERIGLR